MMRQTPALESGVTPVSAGGLATGVEGEGGRPPVGRMRIVHLGKYYTPYRGGMETVLRNLCEAHADRASVTALVARHRPGTVKEQIAGVSIIRVWRLGNPWSVPITPGTLRWIRRLPADILVHHEPNPFVLLVCLLARPRAPFVI